MSMRNPAFELNEDGSAKDPAAFRAALLADEQRVKKLQENPELAHALLQADFDVMQAALRKLREESTKMSELDTSMLMNSMDRMRAKCTTPRDVVAVYQALNKIGLQYGPAFRLLSDVYVPDEVAASQAPV